MSNQKSNSTTSDILLPLGISYFTFRHIHFVFDFYTNKITNIKLGDYICYHFFLPVLFTGPIHRFPEFVRDKNRRRWDLNNLSEGIERIINGYAKVILIGNYISGKLLAEQINRHFLAGTFTYDYFTSINSWINLYSKFSGFSDIAIGFSLIMGFRIIENFHFPLFSKNISIFWQRWHISLTSLVKDYIFSPIASLTRRPFLAVVISMIILGLWHEFSFRYILWGGYHAIGITIWHIFQNVKRKHNFTYPPIINHLLSGLSNLITINFVIMSFYVTTKVNDLIITLL